MKSVRIVRVILLLALILYLWLFHSANRVQVELPLLSFFLPPIPVAYVLAVALLLAWAVGFIPASLRAWRRGRELTRLGARVAELEGANQPPMQVRSPSSTQHPGPRSTYAASEPDVPVIPDRGSPYQGPDATDDEAG